MPDLFDIFFYLFALTTVASAVTVALSRNIVHAAFALLFTFFGVAGIYILLSADFIAVAQILIYVGGVLVLLVFGVMLTNRVQNIDIKQYIRSRIPATILCGLLFATIVGIVWNGHWIKYNEAPWNKTVWNRDAVVRVTSEMQGTTRELLDHEGSQGTALEIGKLSMTDYALPFELVSVILLVALVGAVSLARQDIGAKQHSVKSIEATDAIAPLEEVHA